MPLWPLTLEGFLLHLLGKKQTPYLSFSFSFFSINSSVTACLDDLVSSEGVFEGAFPTADCHGHSFFLGRVTQQRGASVEIFCTLKMFGDAL